MLTVTSALCLQISLLPAPAQDRPTSREFPYVIPCETGASAFAAGDRITIASLRGNRKHLEPDGSYLVQGSYTLASVDRAVLLFSCTSRGLSHPTPITAGQEINITRGTGTFTLKHTSPCDGWFHVSFYVAKEGHSHGGIYFGEKGVERTILRKTDWPDFSAERPRVTADRKSAGEDSGIRSAPANLAILAYLGHPVPAPANLDPRYTPTNLMAAFTALSQKSRWHVRKLAVDDSEFPFLVYGLLDGKHDFREIEKGLREMKGYYYGGSVVGTTDNGSTYFALNMIPHDQYPSGQMVACDRRLVVRLQMLADSARHSE